MSEAKNYPVDELLDMSWRELPRGTKAELHVRHQQLKAYVGAVQQTVDDNTEAIRERSLTEETSEDYIRFGQQRILLRKAERAVKIVERELSRRGEQISV